MADELFPTWGYKPDGSAKIFNLREEDEDLPEGWSRRLEPWNHPNTAHLYSRPAEPAPQAKPKRGRPPKSQEQSDADLPTRASAFDEEPGAELASELRDQ